LFLERQGQQPYLPRRRRYCNQRGDAESLQNKLNCALRREACEEIQTPTSSTAKKNKRILND